MRIPKILNPKMAASYAAKNVKLRAYGISYNKDDYFGTRRMDFEILSNFVFLTQWTLSVAAAWAHGQKPIFTPNTVGESSWG